MKITIGLYREEILEACAPIYQNTPPENRDWPPILGPCVGSVGGFSLSC